MHIHDLDSFYLVEISVNEHRSSVHSVVFWSFKVVSFKFIFCFLLYIIIMIHSLFVESFSSSTLKMHDDNTDYKHVNINQSDCMRYFSK